LSRSIGRVADRLLDPADPLRAEALEMLAPTAGISPEMADAVLAGMACDWTRERLDELLDREFGSVEVLDAFQPLDGGRMVRARGPAISFHVGSGTVPGVGVTSMIRALLVKSAVLLKPGQGDVALPVLFARALREEMAELSHAVAVVYGPGGETELETMALERAPVVVAYGGDEAIASLRARTPVTTRLVTYHHRVSVGLVGREALGSDRAGEMARAAAYAVSMFDQRGCVSPHVLYVEEGGQVEPMQWAGVLWNAMAELEIELPVGQLNSEDASAVHQVRGVAEMREASGTGTRVFRSDDGFATVIFEPEPDFVLSCLSRVVYVKPISDLVEVPEVLRGVARHLQTVALEGSGDRRSALTEALGRVGVTRFTPFREAPWPPPWWHHDGASVFAGLVRWIDSEEPSSYSSTCSSVRHNTI
jgi:putative component of toxin-antitoxin plasmid stabilization module